MSSSLLRSQHELVAVRVLEDHVLPLLDTLMGDLVGHDRTPAAFVVYLFLWKESRRSRRGRVGVSPRQVAEETGLSKSAVQAAVRLLKRRQLLRSYQATQTATPEYEVLRPWVRSPRSG